jgi:hypothetical protein
MPYRTMLCCTTPCRTTLHCRTTHAAQVLGASGAAWAPYEEGFALQVWNSGSSNNNNNNNDNIIIMNINNSNNNSNLVMNITDE